MEKTDLLFIDIETVPETNDFENYPKNYIREDRYCKDVPESMDCADRYFKRAGLFPEFAKIVCISIGYFAFDEIKIKSFWGHDEKKILEDFMQVVNATKNLLCGHNIKSFDIPFIIKRSVINGIKPAKRIVFQGKKPREINLVDTLELWKNGGNVSASLQIIAVCLGLPDPKEEMGGNDVREIYYSCDDGKEKIIKYCEGDVRTTMKIFEKIYLQ